MVEKRKSETQDEASEKQGKKTEMSALQQLRNHTIIVVDTSDLGQISKYKPEDATTNPSLILQAQQNNSLSELIHECVCAHTKGIPEGPICDSLIDDIYDELIVSVGCEILKKVPGKVSTEVDACLSFDTQKSIHKAKKLIHMYESKGIDRSRVMIKMASTWEGCEAAKELQKENIQCNMTLLFTLAQAIAAAEAHATLISPFVGRILDWQLAKDLLEARTHTDTHTDTHTRTYVGCEDPGVQSVIAIYKYYQKYGYKTTIMGASFRNVSQITALCGLDKLTISPGLLQQLDGMSADVPLALTPDFDGNTVSAKVTMDQAMFRWMLNCDAMATEKLAEGIRKFDADSKKLKELIREAIQQRAAE